MRKEERRGVEGRWRRPNEEREEEQRSRDLTRRRTKWLTGEEKLWEERSRLRRQGDEGEIKEKIRKEETRGRGEAKREQERKEKSRVF